MKKIRRKNMLLSIEEIKNCLPHRFPFLMIDRILEINSNSCVVVKNVTINEWFFMGHFPEQAIMPGALIVESMAQAAAFVGMPKNEEQKNEQKITPNKKGYLVAVNIKFQQPVIPGDSLLIKVKVIKTLGNIKIFHAEAFVDNQIMAKGEFTVSNDV